MKSKSDLSVAIAGCGNIAKVHWRFIKKYVSVDKIALCDKDALRLEAFAKETRVGHTYTDLNMLLKEHKPDVVHVLTPPRTHKNIAIQCLDANSHVLIEKPMCLSVSEADEIVNAAQKRDRIACVNHMRLFDPLYLRAKNILDTGSLGEITNVYATYSYDYLKRIHFDPASRWINSLPGGVFFDLLPHLLCIIDDLLPGLKCEKSYIKEQDNLISDLLSIFSSSTGSAIIHMSLNVYPLKNYISVEGTKGVLTIDFRNFLLTWKKVGRFPSPVDRIVDNFSTSTQILSGTMKTLVDVLRSRLDPYAGLKSIIDKLYEAAVGSGRAVVPAGDARKLLLITEQMLSQIPTDKAEKVFVHGFSPQKSTILVTGGTGFIGRKLVNALLNKGYSVRVMTHSNGNSAFKLFIKPVELVVGDIYNYDDVMKACRGIKIVFHLAAAMKGDWNYHMDTTITGTRNILSACKQENIEKCIYVSTLNVYDASKYPENKVIDEGFPYEEFPEYRGSYSHAKLRAEREARFFAKDSSLPITLIRPGLVIDYNNAGLPRDVGLPFGRMLMVLGNGRRKLPLVDVNNLVDALMLALNKQTVKETIYNVVDKEYPTQKEFILVFNRKNEKKMMPLYIPNTLVKVMFWCVEKGVFLLLKKRTYLSYKFKCVAKSPMHSTEKIKSELGWSQKIHFG